MRRLAIHHPEGGLGPKTNPFGKDVANLGLFRALAASPGLERLHVATHGVTDLRELQRALAPQGGPQITTGSILDLAPIADMGALLRGQPNIGETAWLRERQGGGPAAFSLVGLIHSLGPQASRAQIADLLAAPIHEADALVCTSPTVREGVEALLDGWEAHLRGRFGATRFVRPALPVIPLGVDAAAIALQADRSDVRGALRARLGVAEGETLVLWVGRLSFFEKAYPQPMFRAVQAAAERCGVRVHLAMAGWFPDPGNEALYREAAQVCAPDVPLHLLDGNDAALVGGMWAAADIFLSLVDNVQETFGITPIEAKAAGLPVVASSWDGYRSTLRDGVDAFLVPTLLPARNPLGAAMAARQALGVDSYQSYVAAVAQHTAVDVPAAAARLADLIASPELRRRMGAAGRAHVQEVFDWPRVTARYGALIEELAAARRRVRADPSPPLTRPVRGDPFHDFAGFSDATLTPRTRVRPAAGSAARLAQIGAVRLDRLAGAWRGSDEEARALVARLEREGAATVGALLSGFPQSRHAWLMMSLVWLAKLGVLEWGEET